MLCPILVPSQAPQNVTIHNLTSNSFLLTWDPVPHEFANGRIQGYRVRVWEQKHGNVTIFYGNTSVLIDRLNPETEYKVHISAYTSAGEGNSSSLTVTTLKAGKSLPNQCIVLYLVIGANVS